MSALETFIWYFLGYITMPMIFLTGFIGTALVACFIVDQFNIESKKPENSRHSHNHDDEQSGKC